jgi:integrase/recombinase XerD
MQDNYTYLSLIPGEIFMANSIVLAPAQLQAPQAHSDEQLIALWLHGKSEHSQRAYLADVRRFAEFVGKPLQAITLQDLQDYADSLAGLSANTRKRAINSVKSLFTFGHKLGYLTFNVAAALKAPKPKETLAERILTESEVLTMIALTENERDKLLLRLLYASAGRISEVCALKWKDVQPNGKSGQVTLFGKGEKTRAVKLSAETWKALTTIRKRYGPEEPVFRSRKGGHLSPSQAWRIVRAAAKRAGIEGNVSPHWFRHSHASHALERGATVALVRDTLGHSSLAVTSMYVHAKPDESSALHLIV